MIDRRHAAQKTHQNHASTAGSTAADADAAPRLAVVVESQREKLALVVDELLGQQQVVVKNLETHYRPVPGVAGATILGDGRVALILDVGGVPRRPPVSTAA